MEKLSVVIRDSGGYLQGYIGLAAADAAHHIIVAADAVGSANECEHYPAMLDATIANLEGAGVAMEEGEMTMLADRNHFSEENLQASVERGMGRRLRTSRRAFCAGKRGRCTRRV